MRSLVLAIALSAPDSAAQSQCVGDCAGDGTVSINDLILGVNIALGLQPVTACPAFQNAQGEVDIAQLIRGVSNALGGCSAVATATATATSSDTATSTPPPDATATDTVAATATATATEATAAATPTATGVAPATPTATAVAPATSTATSTAGATATATRTATQAAQSTATGTSASTATATSLSTATQTSASTVTPGSDGTATQTPTGVSTATSTVHTPTHTPTDVPTATSTPTPLSTGTVTQSPTASSTSTATVPNSATATATRTATRTATATETALPVGELLAGNVAIAAAGLRSVHSLVAAFVSQVNKGGDAGFQGPSSPLAIEGPAPDPNACSINGTSERTCSEMGAGNDKTIRLKLDATECVVAGPSGGPALFDGIITLESNPSSTNDCDPLTFTSGTYEFGQSGAVQGLIVDFRDALLEPSFALQAFVTGNMAIGQPPPPTCRVGTLMLTLHGIALTRFDTGSDALGIESTFSGTELTVDMITYNADCVPLSYRLKVNGIVSFTAARAAPDLVADGDGSVGGIGTEIITSFTANFTNLFLAQSHASGSVTSQISGQMSSNCFGTEVMLATVDPVVVGASDICPNAGKLSVTSFAGPATVTYQGSQVNIVQGGIEKIFPSCFAEMLVSCIPQ